MRQCDNVMEGGNVEISMTNDKHRIFVAKHSAIGD